MKQTAVANAVRVSLFVVAMQAALPVVAQAENTAPQSQNDVEHILVTGSRIAQTDLETANPVVVIDAAEIAAAGYQSIHEVLDNLTQNAGGSLSPQDTYGFTPGASGVDLRGIGMSRTLTLINGKRVAKFPLGNNGTDGFTDTNAIPMAMVDRIEVLTSGASAIYGSDAMGGVINIILKQDIEQTTFNAEFTDTHDGGGQTNSFSLVTGTTGEDGTNLSFFLDYQDVEKISAADRPYFGTDLNPDSYFGHPSIYGVSLASLDFSYYQTLSQSECEARGLLWIEPDGMCGYDRNANEDLFPESKKYSAMISLNKPLGENGDHLWFARMNYGYSESEHQLSAMLIDDLSFIYTVADGMVTVKDSQGLGLSQSFAQDIAFGGDFASLVDGDYLYMHRLTEIGDRHSKINSHSFSFVTGLEGYLNDAFEYSLDWSLSEQRISSSANGSPSYQGMFDYMISGEAGVSLLDEIPDDVVQSLLYESSNEAKSSFSQLHAGVTGELPVEFAGGMLAIATGMEYSLERLTNELDNLTQSGGLIGVGGSAANAERKQYAAYVEAQLPLTEALNVSLAGRYDYYDDVSEVGGQFSPQIAFEYRPLDNLLMRGLYAQTFRAADLMRMQGSVSGYASVFDPINEISIPSVGYTLEGTPNLKAETGTNYNLGVVYSGEQWHASLDYWWIEIKDMLTQYEPQFIIDNEELFEGWVTRLDSGYISSVKSQSLNQALMETSGIDAGFGYWLATDIGEFKYSLNLSYLLKNDHQITADSEVIDYLESDNSKPKLRLSTAINWQQGALSSRLAANYLDSMNGAMKSVFEGMGLDQDYDVTVDSHIEVDWQGNYQVNDAVNLRLGVNNIFNAEPELDATSQGYLYATKYYDIRGREYFVGVEMSF